MKSLHSLCGEKPSNTVEFATGQSNSLFSVAYIWQPVIFLPAPEEEMSQ